MAKKSEAPVPADDDEAPKAEADQEVLEASKEAPPAVPTAEAPTKPEAAEGESAAETLAKAPEPSKAKAKAKAKPKAKPKTKKPVEAPAAEAPAIEVEPAKAPEPPESEAQDDEEEEAAAEEPEPPAPPELPEAEAEAEPEEDEEPPEPEVELPKQLLFGKWDLSEVTVSDPGLARYINLHSFRLPHTGARHANHPFAKSKITIVERLINDMMRTEIYTGKKAKAYNVVRDAFEIVGTKVKQNPVQILVSAIENSAPKEGTTSLRYGGIRIFKSVDMSPSRRLDFALRNISEGAVAGSHKSHQSIHASLAKELRLAAQNNTDSYAVSKKEEVERRAESAR